ncbi:MAG: hypothetical protein WC242_04135 [Candidatus Paceibacterota bacterium]
MTTRSRSMEVYPSVQRIYQEHLPDNVTAVQTAVARVRKEFEGGQKLKRLEVIIGLSLSDLDRIWGRSYRLYMDPTGAGQHRLYGCHSNTIMTIHFINEDKLQVLKEYRRSIKEERENRKRQEADNRL